VEPTDEANKSNCLSIEEFRKKSLQRTIRSIFIILFTDHQRKMQHCTTRKNYFFRKK